VPDVRHQGMKIAAWSVVGITAVLAVVLASRFGTDPALAPSPLIGRPAPQVSLTRLLGEGNVALDDFGDDIVVVNFFASWCLECRLEHDALVATADSFAGGGVSFVGIAFQDDPGDSIEFLEDEGMSPATEYLIDEGSRAAIAFGVFGIPETFFIDGAGTVVGRIIGPTDALTLGSSIDAIRRGEDPGQQVLGNTRSAPGDS
jgi:cytochrome c biogenesis protein CcmG/thiol:disulfide interchange protein DsbE